MVSISSINNNYYLDYLWVWKNTCYLSPSSH